jgi:hypothetical protein
MNDYAGNAGSSLEDGDNSGIYGDGRDGVIVMWGQVPFVRFRNITDGLSKTLLIGEKRMNISFCSIEPQADDNEGYVAGFQDDVVRFGSAASAWGPIVPDIDFTGPRYGIISWLPMTFQFGSSHSGVTQFVLCDGSVQAIANTIAPATFQCLSVRNDAKIVDPFSSP